MTPSPKPPPRRRPSVRRTKPTRSASGGIGTIDLPTGHKPHPELGLGLWNLGRWSPEEEAREKATAARAYERGLRWFDTAEVYGNGRSERILGEMLHRTAADGADAFVTTKVSWEHLRATQVRASLINSLERLARTSVDLYLVHAPDPHVPLAETMGALEALYQEGRIGAIGVSNFGLAELEEAARHLSEARITVNQLQYNLFDRDDADPVREYCRTHGILIEAYTPLARGLLHGRYLDAKRIPPDVKRFASRFFDPDRLPEILARGRALRDLAKHAGVPLPSIALHWLRSQGAVPLVGSSRPEQVDSNLEAWAIRPPERVLQEADAIARGDRA